MSDEETSTPCRCGNRRQRMRTPDDWDAETVAKWRALEERFTCDECSAKITLYYTDEAG